MNAHGRAIHQSLISGHAKGWIGTSQPEGGATSRPRIAHTGPGRGGVRLSHPDRLIYPDLGSWRAILSTARLLRKMLDALGLRAWVKTTGSRGLHVVVPLKPSRWT